jgi:hypothetical protein
MQDKLSGGLADKKTIKDIADDTKSNAEDIKKAVDQGKEQEKKEHTKDSDIATEIAKDHVEEKGPKYYDELEKMEKKLNKLNENAYIKHIENATGFKGLKQKWEDANIKVRNSGKIREASDGRYWKEVKEEFDKEVGNQQIQEAQKIMDHRNKYQQAAQTLLNHLAGDNYTEAGKVFPDVVSYRLNDMIASKRDDFLKSLADKTRNKITGN